jgi:hypothetical protein
LAWSKAQASKKLLDHADQLLRGGRLGHQGSQSASLADVLVAGMQDEWHATLIEPFAQPCPLAIAQSEVHNGRGQVGVPRQAQSIAQIVCA